VQHRTGRMTVKYDDTTQAWETPPPMPDTKREPNWVELATDLHHCSMLLNIATEMRNAKPGDVKAARFYCYAWAQMTKARVAATNAADRIGDEMALAT
jgi:hypothetical protein